MIASNERSVWPGVFEVDEEIDHSTWVWPTIDIVAKKDDKVGFELIRANSLLKVFPERSKLVDMTVDVTNDDNFLVRCTLGC